MFRHMSRSKQQLPEGESIEFLRACTSGVLAVHGDEGYPYAVPPSYAYEAGRVIFWWSRLHPTMRMISMTEQASKQSGRDPRFVTIRRGGTLTDAHHHLLAAWAADCAKHVLHYFEEAHPDDTRPRRAIEQAYAWARGEITMTQAREAAYAAHAAAREAGGAAREAARAAGHAVAVAHMADHELGGSAYGIRAVRAAAVEEEREEAGRRECEWQRAQLPAAIRELVLDDEKRRNEKCWSLFY